jgi:hypothetical protein
MVPRCMVSELRQIAERTAVILESLQPEERQDFLDALDQQVKKVCKDIRRAARGLLQ